MAERDRFELDLADALRAYAEDAPTQVRPTELARHFASAYPRRGTAIRPWRLAAIPRLVWALLLLAGLLTALVAGLLAAGSQPEPKLPAVVPPVLPFGTPPPRVAVSVGPVPTCPPGSTPDKRGPVDQARPVGLGHMAFDRRAGRLVALADSDTDVQTWTFDVCTNAWAQMHPNREPPNFTINPLVYDVDSDLTLGIAFGPDGAPPGRVWAYDLAADTWTEKGVVPTSAEFGAYDPLSGLIVATVDSVDGASPAELWVELWDYDVSTDTWTLTHKASGPGGIAAYDASVDRMISPGSPTLLFDLRTGTWSRSGVETPVVEPNWAVPVIAYDEAAERTVMAGSSGWAAYDASTDRWEVLAGSGASFAKPFAYDPVNRRLIGMAQGGIANEGDVVAFDLVTREWTVLLGPSDGQTAPP